MGAMKRFIESTMDLLEENVSWFHELDYEEQFNLAWDVSEDLLRREFEEKGE